MIWRPTSIGPSSRSIDIQGRPSRRCYDMHPLPIIPESFDESLQNSRLSTSSGACVKRITAARDQGDEISLLLAEGWFCGAGGRIIVGQVLVERRVVEQDFILVVIG